MARPRDLVRRAGGPRLRRKKGKIEQLYKAPPEGSVVVCLDQMGPDAAKSYQGRQAVQTRSDGTVPRAKQELDYGRRGKGYTFGAFRPHTGDAFTTCYSGRTIVNWVDFLLKVESWLPPEFDRVYAILDNLSVHRAKDVLLFMLAHPRWEFVFQPVYAGYLNLIEAWWKALRSLALKGRRFETWEDVEKAIAEATAYWNAHKRPYEWGKRGRHRPRRPPGIALAPPHRLAG